ncbi:hypothetical protein LTR28_001132, partial [Elasticomyces elasticus]
MHFLSASAFALLLLPYVVAVTLSDFTPRIGNLQPSCEAVYMTDIAGCAPSDFTSRTGCSVSCIGALSNFTKSVQAACNGQGITGQNVVAAFLSGAGMQSLCPNWASAS